jgi:hypothetical protein
MLIAAEPPINLRAPRQPTSAGSQSDSASNTQRSHTAHRPNHGLPSKGLEVSHAHSTLTCGRSRSKTAIAASTAFLTSSSLLVTQPIRRDSPASSSTMTATDSNVDSNFTMSAIYAALLLQASGLPAAQVWNRPTAPVASKLSENSRDVSIAKCWNRMSLPVRFG